MFSVVLCVALAPAAPVPAPKPLREVRPADLVGQWNLTWAGYTYSARFNPDGTYSCWVFERSWVGSWRLEGDVLTVSERPASSAGMQYGGNGPSHFVWSVKLHWGRRGVIKGESAPHQRAPAVAMSRPVAVASR